jgi:hypothetical protein
MLENFYQTTQRHIPEDGTLHSHRCDSLRYSRFISYQAEQVGLAIPFYFNARHLGLYTCINHQFETGLIEIIDFYGLTGFDPSAPSSEVQK